MSTDPRQSALLQWLSSLPEIFPQDFHMISGDASFRRYFRFQSQGGSFIGVDAPPDKEKNHEFVALAREYRTNNVPVPQVLHSNMDLGFLMLQDFGDCLFSQRIETEDPTHWYQQALSHLPAVQKVRATAGEPLPAFDQELLANEYSLFNDWLLQTHLNLTLTDSEWKVIHEAQAFLSEVFLSQPQVGVHRDYHSRNLMILPDDSIGIIDFQDAVTGPITYDAVSLLRDCYVVWPIEFVMGQLQELHVAHYAEHDWETFKHWFDCTGMQRHIKASGIFARLCHRDGKTGYLNDIPRTLQYLVTVGRTIQECTEFAELVANKILPAVEAKQ
ncbi:phosphotransferase [Paraneptunicella aestuarii]|uniref:aminoglycoside phosphotransferase family protein n=1 Tax=Paraneptunicella aestuarii TaxID=2831148 RepID=UPI001E5869EA|nr:phosphotransferase [Paraneptunicella aestuarii]UAA39555.1 phosphotransferase [Paraneptunicella aestuarii]